MTEITITVGDLEFQFESMGRWISLGPDIWRKHNLRGEDALCVDAKGRICRMGEHFKRAESDSAYPIKVYRKNPISDGT